MFYLSLHIYIRGSMLAIRISDLYKTYPPDVRALKGLSLEIKQGSFFALLGPNGSGKSTTIGIVSSLVQKNSGNVEVFGYDIDKQLSEAKSCIGIVPQEFNFSMFETLLDILINQAGYFGIKKSIALTRAEKYLNLLGLWHKRNSKAGQLSGGMKRRLMIARAMIHEPKILILDEPTAGVDVEVRHQIWKFLQLINKEQNITIVLTTHYLEEAEHLCEEVAIINGGKIIMQGLMRDVLASFSKQTYIVELSSSIEKTPNLKGIELKIIDSYNIEVEFDSPDTISSVVKKLSSHKIEIKTLSLRKSRLEELFLKLTGV